MVVKVWDRTIWGQKTLGFVVKRIPMLRWLDLGTFGQVWHGFGEEMMVPWLVGLPVGILECGCDGSLEGRWEE